LDLFGENFLEGRDNEKAIFGCIKAIILLARVSAVGYAITATLTPLSNTSP
jgi:hypothetical protein